MVKLYQLQACLQAGDRRTSLRPATPWRRRPRPVEARRGRARKAVPSREEQPPCYAVGDGCKAGAPKRAPAFMHSGDASAPPLPVQRLADEWVERSRLSAVRHVLRADARIPAIREETGAAQSPQLAIAPALPAIRIATGTQRTVRDAPVMVGTSVPTAKAVRHRVVG
jgi:hypothetical protein